MKRLEYEYQALGGKWVPVDEVNTLAHLWSYAMCLGFRVIVRWREVDA